jgi:hypothetical protein
MPFKTRTKWKRILNEIEFLYDELTLIEELTKDSAIEFESYYRAYCAKNELDRNQLNQDNKERIQDLYGKDPEILPQDISVSEHSGSAALVLSEHEETEEEQESCEEMELFKGLHDEFNKLFKKLALKLHPDRIENFVSNDEYKRRLAWDFSKAKSAIEKKKYFQLIQLAKKYDVLIPENYEAQLKWFRRERDKLSGDIQQVKGTYNYKFAECENDEERDKLMKSFIAQVFNFIVK